MTRAPTEGFFPPRSAFLVHLRVQVIMKYHMISVFLSDKLISNFNVFNNIKITLCVYMRTSGEKIHTLDETEHVQSVSYSHIRHLPRAPLCNCNVYCKVAYLAFKGAQQQLQCITGLLCFQRGPQQQW